MFSFLPFCFQWRVKCPSKAIFPMVPKHSACVMYREVTGCFLVWVPTLGRLTQWWTQQDSIKWSMGDRIWVGGILDSTVLLLVSMSQCQYKYLESLKLTGLLWWVYMPRTPHSWSFLIDTNISVIVISRLPHSLSLLSPSFYPSFSPSFFPLSYLQTWPCFLGLTHCYKTVFLGTIWFL